MKENVNHPAHYKKDGRKECIEEMIDIFGESAVYIWCVLNHYKYNYRKGEKENNSEEQDIKKGAWYMNYISKLNKDNVPHNVIKYVEEAKIGADKICTSLEQSKKLVELGVDVNTADMYWWYSGERYYVESMDDGDYNKVGDIPAWSLTALLEYAKHTYKDGYIAIESCVGDDERWQLAIYSYEVGSVKAFEELKLFDAAFQAVCWLKENKL